METTSTPPALTTRILDVGRIPLGRLALAGGVAPSASADAQSPSAAFNSSI